MRVLLVTPENPHLTFWDDQLFADPDYAYRLFGALAGLQRQWAAMVTLSSTRDESLLGLDGATVSLLVPFPGTPLFAELERSGRLLTRDWSYFNGKTAVTFQPARMTPEVLWNGYMGFRRRFYSSSCIRERLQRSRIRSPQSLVLNWGYARALDNAVPGWPIPGARRSDALDWPVAGS